MTTAVKAAPFARNHAIRDALSRALYEGLRRDPSVHLFGEGCEVKQHYDAPDLLRDFPQRIHTMPIAEDGIVNFAVGASLMGILPVVDIISADFLYRAMDSLCNTAAKANHLQGAQRTIVVRAEFLTGGPTAGQRPEALFTHVPGLTVHVPSTPADAYGLMTTALTTPGVHLIFEDRNIEDEGYFQREDFYSQPGPFGRISWRVRNPAANATVLTYGLMRQRVEALVARENLRVNLYDLRSLYPLDMDGVMDAVHRTHRLLIVEPGVLHGGVGAEIAAQVAEAMPQVRVKRLGAPRVTIPQAGSAQARLLPSDQEVRDALNF